MENLSNTNRIFILMKWLTWIVFIGLCVKTGALALSFFVSLAINHGAAKDVYMGLDLSALQMSNQVDYMAIMLFIISTWAAKAFMFFMVIKILTETNFAQPFNNYTASLITNISYIALAIGTLALMAVNYSEGLAKKGFMTNTLAPYIDGGAEFIFLAGIVFIISMIFKRGIEIQTENELTV